MRMSSRTAATMRIARPNSAVAVADLQRSGCGLLSRRTGIEPARTRTTRVRCGLRLSVADWSVWGSVEQRRASDSRAHAAALRRSVNRGPAQSVLPVITDVAACASLEGSALVMGSGKPGRLEGS